MQAPQTVPPRRLQACVFDFELEYGGLGFRGTLLWGPYNKDPTIWGTILESPIFGNPPIYRRGCMIHCLSAEGMIKHAVSFCICSQSLETQNTTMFICLPFLRSACRISFHPVLRVFCLSLSLSLSAHSLSLSAHSLSLSAHSLSLALSLSLSLCLSDSVAG